jgi:ABC-type transport system substrate-binding protein
VRIVAICGAALAALTLLVAAASGGKAARAKEGGTFRVIEAGLFGTIDPALASNIAEAVILRPACAGLLTFPHKPLPAGIQVEPELAEAHPVVSRDRKTYTFRIRRDARYSNGARVTARDFVRALERIFDPAMRSPFAPPFESIVGAREMLDGKATKLRGVVAKGRTLVVRLVRPVPDFPLLVASTGNKICAVPPSLPVDPEGVKAPLASPAPYYVARYVPGERVVLERNRFYRGSRPHHVDRFIANLAGSPATVFDQVLRGEADYALGPPPWFADKADDLARRYGVNKTRFHAVPALGVRMFALNTSRPLFGNNVKLRQAVNFAVNRRALTRELGPYAGTPSDQYMPPTMPGYRDERIYPLRAPDLRKARALAAGRTRSRKAVLYTIDAPLDLAQAAIVRQNLRKIGLEVEIQKFPITVLFQKLATPGEPFDIGRVSWGGLFDPGFLSFLFDGSTIGKPEFGNWSYFDSPKYNRLLQRASKLPIGRARNRAFGELDVQLSRDAAPGIAYGVLHELTLVSGRTGCVIVNPSLDLTPVCLK